MAPKAGHFAAKAKRCIFLFMVGGPSHMDMFDPKPTLDKLDGKPLPESFGKIHSQFLEADGLCLGSRRRFGKYGQSGIDMSDLVPHMHPLADDLAVLRSCVADSVIHAPAHYQMNSGRVFMGYPSLGSWVTYGLGSESENLPSFVVMTQPEGTPEGGAPCWGAGFLPASYQGTLFRPGANPIVNLRSADPSVTPDRQRRTLDFLKSMDELNREPEDSELAARISSYTELAFRMPERSPGGRKSTSRLPNRRRRGRYMDWTTRRRTISAPAACWRGGSLSAACGSFRSIPAAARSRRNGTPTTTSRPTTSICADGPTSLLRRS